MELIVVIAIILTSLVGLISLLSYSINGISPGKNKIIAINLAQEGLEVVRNIRDNNWLEGKRSSINWNDGLGSGNYRVEYDCDY